MAFHASLSPVENLARLLQVSLELLLDAERLGESSLRRYWHPVLAAISVLASLRIGPVENHSVSL